MNETQIDTVVGGRWQFPHFFALGWFNRADYSRGNFAMVPCNDPTGARTSAHAPAASFLGRQATFCRERERERERES